MTLNNFLIYLDAAEQWQIGFQDPATPVMEGIINFHHDLMFFLIVTTIFMCWSLIKCTKFFDKNICINIVKYDNIIIFILLSVFFLINTFVFLGEVECQPNLLDGGRSQPSLLNQFEGQFFLERQSEMQTILESEGAYLNSSNDVELAIKFKEVFTNADSIIRDPNFDQEKKKLISKVLLNISEGIVNNKIALKPNCYTPNFKYTLFYPMLAESNMEVESINFIPQVLDILTTEENRILIEEREKLHSNAGSIDHKIRNDTKTFIRISLEFIKYFIKF